MDDTHYDRAWHPTRGCSPVSPGCDNCTGQRMAYRMSKPGDAYHGLAALTPNGPRWTGAVRVVEEQVPSPLFWRQPRRILVSNTSDLFHETLAANDIARVFAIMAQAPRHTFQVLTKRAERMRDLMRDASFIASVAGFAGDLTLDWPLRNVWLGISAEDQRRYDERFPLLCEAPAAVRWVSVEPQIGPVSIAGRVPAAWYVQGGESGPGARPFHIEWGETLREQCHAAGVAYFAKQGGANAYWKGERWQMRNGHGSDPAEWPVPCVREYPTT